MAKETLVDLNTDRMIEYITRGHSFNKHVMGDDSVRSGMQGLNAFRAETDNFGKKLGADLFIETPDDAANYLKNRFLTHPQTSGYISPIDGTVNLYNKADNVAVHFSVKDGQLDLGTMYRYSDTEQRFLTILTAAQGTASSPFPFSSIDNASNPNSALSAVENLVEDVKARPEMYLKNPRNPNSTVEQRVLAEPDRPGRGWNLDEIIKPANNVKGHSEAYAAANGMTDILPSEFARVKAEMAEEMNIRKVSKSLTAALPELEKTSPELAQAIAQLSEGAGQANAALAPAVEAAEKTPLFGKAFKTAAYALGGALPFIGVLPATAEASDLKNTLQTAVENGHIPEAALPAYNVIMLGHIAQGADPTIFAGEVAIQAAFNDWADRYDIQGELRESLQPTSLGLMMKDGGVYISQNIERLPSATVDVAGFAGQQAIAGVGALAAGAGQAITSAYENMSGVAAQRQAIYDALPVLERAANDELYDPSHADADPIHNYPTAHDMAQIKTQIVDTQNTIEQINNGTKEPFGYMNRAESADFLQERITRLQDRFESTYDAAKADGTLDEVQEYAAQYGAFNADKAAQSLAVQPLEPAANQSWDEPKARALAM